MRQEIELAGGGGNATPAQHGESGTRRSRTSGRHSGYERDLEEGSSGSSTDSDEEEDSIIPGGGGGGDVTTGSVELPKTVTEDQPLLAPGADPTRGASPTPGTPYRQRRQRRRRRVFRVTTTAFIVALILGTTVFAIVAGPIYWGPVPLMSNGTDLFASTVVMLSFDGMRSDYLDRGLTPTLSRIASEGVRAPFMTPSFPSTTFANHYTMTTGLYPEHHGIIANSFYDAKLNDTFNYGSYNNVTTKDSDWWGGEPIWITAVKQRQRSAAHLWVGSEVEVAGHRPTYWTSPFDPNYPPMKTADQVLDWLDLPRPDRPQLIAAYIPTVDTVGHSGGPDSQATTDALRQVEEVMAYLDHGLAERNLTDIVNLIVVGDHGMTKVRKDGTIWLDDLIDMERIHSVHSVPLALITPKYANETGIIYKQLKEASRNKPFDVYLREQVPERFRFNSNPRISPIVCIPKLGWIVTTRSNPYHGQGAHGYDNEARDMRTIFVARGPSIQQSSITHRPISSFPNVNLYGLVARILHLVPAITDGSDFWIGSSGILRED